MTRNCSETDSGMVWNSSDSLGMNFKPILPPGLSQRKDMLGCSRIYVPKDIPNQSERCFESRSIQSRFKSIQFIML